MRRRSRASSKLAKARSREAMPKRDSAPASRRSSSSTAGAVNVSRSFLEFRVDPASPSHDKNFAKDKNVIVYCGSGGRAALGVFALRLRALVGLLLALERRRIAHPRLRTRHCSGSN